jgi:hypothetical protein
MRRAMRTLCSGAHTRESQVFAVAACAQLRSTTLRRCGECGNWRAAKIGTNQRFLQVRQRTGYFSPNRKTRSANLKCACRTSEDPQSRQENDM